MARYPLRVSTSEFREWLSKFGKLVEKKQYHKLAYDQWRPMYLWSKPDTEWEEIEINVFHDPDIFYILPRHSEKPSPDGVEIRIDGAKSFGQYLMDVADNSQIQNALSASASTLNDAISSASAAIKSLGSSFTSLAYRPEYLDISNISTSIDAYTSRTYEFDVDGLTIKENGESMSLEDYLNKILEKNSNNNSKENEKTMNFNFDFGPVDSSVRMSMYGMAVKNANGTYVAYDAANGRIMDVDILNFEGANKFIYKMPVATKDVAVGDVVIHMRKPMIVTGIVETGSFTVVDVFNGEEKTIVPATSPFGWNFMTKIVSLVNFGQADSTNPFGNMLPFLLLSDSKSDDMLPLMLMMNGGAIDTSNPMMLWALAGNRTNDPLMLMALMGGFNPANK